MRRKMKAWTTVNRLCDDTATCEIPERWGLKFVPGINLKRSLTTEEAREIGMIPYDTEE